MVHSVQTLMSVQTIVTTVIATLHVLIRKDPGHAHATQVILAMVHHVPILMSALTIVTTVPSMQPVRTTRDHFHVLAMRDIQAMELFA
jgi:hypothetical protein